MKVKVIGTSICILIALMLVIGSFAIFYHIGHSIHIETPKGTTNVTTTVPKMAPVRIVISPTSGSLSLSSVPKFR